jgi:hypothetical protein
MANWAQTSRVNNNKNKSLHIDGKSETKSKMRIFSLLSFFL